MESAIGVLVAERIAGALVIDHTIAGAVQSFPEHNSVSDALQGIPSEIIVQRIVDVVKPLLNGSKPSAIGLGFPGIIRNGAIEDSPNLVQLKGVHISERAAGGSGANSRGHSDCDLQRRGRCGCGACGYARAPGPADPGLDAWKRHRLWPISISGRRLGRRASRW